MVSHCHCDADCRRLARLIAWILAATVGIVYPPNLLFLLAALFVLFLLLYFSTVITRLTQENKDIAQQVALLQYEIEALRADTNKLGRPPANANQDEAVNHE